MIGDPAGVDETYRDTERRLRERIEQLERESTQRGREVMTNLTERVNRRARLEAEIIEASRAMRDAKAHLDNLHQERKDIDIELGRAVGPRVRTILYKANDGTFVQVNYLGDGDSTSVKILEITDTEGR